MCRQAYTFADLPQVQAFQLAWLRRLGVANPTLAPQSVLAATEQGWLVPNLGASGAPLPGCLRLKWLHHAVTQVA